MDSAATTLTGLSEAEACRRLQDEGYNALATAGRRSVPVIAFEVVKEPMFLMLVACGAVYLLMGKEHIGDASLLLGFVFV
ncbi:MAG TPA: cation-transporting P-type ATPase, partial [Sumerlaeia bacterium]|nr:cation-transporting P-type ATPase [Sumerlaeia bacterium]